MRYVVFILIAFFCSNFVQGQNYLNDGGFEITKTAFSLNNIANCGNDYTGSCYPLGDSYYYYTTCPGGYAKVAKGLQYWTDRSSDFFIDCGATGFCAIHCPDWVFNSVGSYPGYQGAEATDPITCPFGNSCVAASTYEVFEQQMGRPIIYDGNYLVSASIITSRPSPWAYPPYNIRFILSQAQPTYKAETCSETLRDNPDDKYRDLQNVDLPIDYTFSDPILDWGRIEIPIQVSDVNPFAVNFNNIAPRKTHNWFSVDVVPVHGSTESYPPYVGFDEIYISDAACYCPIVRYIGYNQPAITSHLVPTSSPVTFQGLQNIGAQQYLYLGNVDVINSTNGPTDISFTAGQAVNLSPGFKIEPGAVAQIKMAPCFTNYGPTGEFFIPNPLSTCIHSDGSAQFCFYTKNITQFAFELYDVLGQQVILLVTGSVNTSVFASNGYNKVCIDYPFPITDQPVEYKFTGTGCLDAHKESSGTIILIDDCVHKTDVSYKDTLDLDKNHVVKIYPDPFCQSLTIESPFFKADDYVLISDMNGKMVYKIQINGINTLFDLSLLQNGVYIAAYVGLNYSVNQKLVKTCN